jgi:hypothetical protein
VEDLKVLADCDLRGMELPGQVYDEDPAVPIHYLKDFSLPLFA